MVNTSANALYSKGLVLCTSVSATCAARAARVRCTRPLHLRALDGVEHLRKSARGNSRHGLE
eukprot:268692-Alexandrium_andersonii.AAC.1